MKLNSIINTGTSSLSEADRKGVIVSNLISFSMTIVSTTYIPIFYLAKMPILSFFSIILTGLYFISIIFNKLGFYDFSKAWIKLLLDFAIFIFAWASGPECGIQNGFFLTMILPFLMFRSAPKALAYSIVSPACFIILAIWSPQQWYSGLVNPKLLYITTVLTVFSLIGLIQFALSSQNEAYQAKLENALKTKQSLLNMLAHDVNNPLTAALSHLHLFISKSEENERLNKIKKSLLSIDGIVRNARTMQAIEQGKFQSENSLFTFQSVFEELKEIFEIKCKKKNIKINYIHNLNEEDLIFADKTSMTHSILANILSNAIKFSHIGGVIDFKAIADQDFIIVEIRDYGIGMSKELQSRLFDHNTATNRKGTHGEGGTGFGMPLVQQMTELMNMKVYIKSWEQGDESANPPGTLVGIRIPKAQK